MEAIQDHLDQLEGLMESLDAGRRCRKREAQSVREVDASQEKKKKRRRKLTR